MEKVRISRICGTAVIACLVVLVNVDSGGQENKHIREVYQAQAMGQSTQLGQNFNVTINIDRYSTPEERQVLVDAFQQAGSEGLFNARSKK